MTSPGKQAATRLAATALCTLLALAAAGSQAQTNTPPAAGAAASTNAPAARRMPINHAAKRCKVTATSTHTSLPGELGPAALVDGDLATRWSSDYGEPQQVVLHFDKPLALSKLRLHWEHACATRYTVSTSANGRDWKSVYLFMNTAAKPLPRVDSITLAGDLVLALKLDLIKRVNPEWGFSLHEVEALTKP